MNKKLYGAALLLTMLLDGCGGGGGGGSASVPAMQGLSVPLQTAVANQVNKGITVGFSVSGTVAGAAVTGSGTLADDPAVAATLNGVSVLKTTEHLSGTLMANGTSATFSSARTIYRNSATCAEIAEDMAGAYIVFPDYVYPSTVRAGDAGPLMTATEYSSSAQTSRIGSISLSYSVAADTTSSLLVTFIEADFDDNNVKTADAQTTFRVDISGTLQFVSLKVTRFVVNGNERADLTFQTP